MVTRAVAAGVPARWATGDASALAPEPRASSWYSWALVEIIDTEPGHHHLLVRRNDKTGELAYYRCYSPDSVTLADYV